MRQQSHCNHEGGKFIASGSFGCVHYPHLQCSDGTNIPKAIGKLFFDTRDMNEERDTTMYVQNTIDPHHKFTIPLVGQCKVKKFLKRDQIKRCLTPLKNTKPQHYQQLLYPHAGTSVFSIITKNYKSQSTLTKHFFKIFLGMQNIIEGLQALNKHQYIHADIKLDNLMMKQGQLYLIDFGIAQHEHEMYSIKNTNGILSADQVYYPPEFKAFTKKYRSFNDFHNDYLHAWKDDGELFNILQEIHRNNYDEDIRNAFKMTRSTIKSLAAKTDTFSLGIELLELLVICRIPQTVSNNANRSIKLSTFIEMYIELIRGMTRLDPHARWSVSEVKKQYSLMVDYWNA